jgi:hypothetical protein
MAEKENAATKGDSKLDEGQCNSGLESALSGARTEADHRRNWLLGAVASLFHSRHASGLRALWRELCSLPSRIAISRRNNWFRYGTSPDCYVQGLPLPPDMRRKCRGIHIRGIQILRTIHPAATPVDVHILLNAIDLQILLECRDKEAGLCESPCREMLPRTLETKKCKEGS